MPITPSDLKGFAEGLSTSSDETELRASISRAYYAAFHAILPLAELLPKSAKCPPRCNHVTHQEMYERLVEWRTVGVHPALSRMTGTKGQLAKAIDIARVLREKADYRIGHTVVSAEAQSQVARAKLIIRQMAQVEAEMQKDDVA